MIGHVARPDLRELVGGQLGHHAGQASADSARTILGSSPPCRTDRGGASSGAATASTRAARIMLASGMR